MLAYLTFPVDHWKSISSTNAIERVNAELDRRAKVVGIFPNIASLMRLFTAVLQDQHDEWQDGRRHFSQQSMARLLHPEGPALAHQPAHRRHRCLTQRRCENSSEFTPLQGT